MTDKDQFQKSVSLKLETIGTNGQVIKVETMKFKFSIANNPLDWIPVQPQESSLSQSNEKLLAAKVERIDDVGNFMIKFN